MDMGRVHGGERGVRAGRAERAGMHWGSLKSSDRGMGPRGHRKRAWGEGEGMEPGSRAWGPWNGAGGAGGGGGESGHGKGAWGDGVGRAGRAERAGMDWGPSSHLIGAWGHGVVGSVHGGGGCVGGGSHVRHGAMSWSP